MPVINLLTDLTINDGWNLAAVAFYTSLFALAVAAWTERKKND